MESGIISCCYGQDPSVGDVPECWVQITCSTCMAVQAAGINISLYSTGNMFSLFKVVCSKVAIYSLFVWRWYRTPYSQFFYILLWAFQQNNAKSRIKIYSVNNRLKKILINIIHLTTKSIVLYKPTVLWLFNKLPTLYEYL
jgi:hypothetical protein